MQLIALVQSDFAVAASRAIGLRIARSIDCDTLNLYTEFSLKRVKVADDFIGKCGYRSVIEYFRVAPSDRWLCMHATQRQRL